MRLYKGVYRVRPLSPPMVTQHGQRPHIACGCDKSQEHMRPECMGAIVRRTYSCLLCAAYHAEMAAMLMCPAWRTQHCSLESASRRSVPGTRCSKQQQLWCRTGARGARGCGAARARCTLATLTSPPPPRARTTSPPSGAPLLPGHVRSPSCTVHSIRAETVRSTKSCACSTDARDLRTVTSASSSLQRHIPPPPRSSAAAHSVRRVSWPSSRFQNG